MWPNIYLDIGNVPSTSLDQIHENLKPVKDFRDLVSNLQTIEESMTSKAKTTSQKVRLLIVWERLRSLLTLMIDRLEKDIEHSREIEAQIESAKEQARNLNYKNQYFSKI